MVEIKSSKSRRYFQEFREELLPIIRRLSAVSFQEIHGRSLQLLRKFTLKKTPIGGFKIINNSRVRCSNKRKLKGKDEEFNRPLHRINPSV